MQAAPETLQASLPPGVLLTLVENALEHGVGPALQAVQVRVAAGPHDWMTRRVLVGTLHSLQPARMAVAIRVYKLV